MTIQILGRLSYGARSTFKMNLESVK